MAMGSLTSGGGTLCSFVGDDDEEEVVVVRKGSVLVLVVEGGRKAEVVDRVDRRTRRMEEEDWKCIFFVLGDGVDSSWVLMMWLQRCYY